MEEASATSRPFPPIDANGLIELCMEHGDFAVEMASSQRVDLECGYLIHVFDTLAGWTDNPCCKDSTVQELNLSAVELKEQRTFLQLHVPKLKILSLQGITFSYISATVFTEWLRAKHNSLEKLCLTCTEMHTDVVPLFFSALHNHSTWKEFKVEIWSAHFRFFGRVVRTVTETLAVCQLQSLHLDIFVDHRLHDDSYSENYLSMIEEEDSDLYFVAEAEKDSNPDYAAFVQAFATNATLTDVHFSNKIIEHMPAGDAEKIYFYAKRNKEFQNLTSISTMDSGGDESVASTTIPLGLWPHILEEAHKRFPDLSMLHCLLSSQTVALLLARREENDHYSEHCITTNKDTKKSLL
jgi:hypothetical protein